MPGQVVDVLVTEDRLAYPRVTPVIAAQQSRDLGRHEHAVAGHIRVACRTGPRRVRQEPLVVTGDPCDALELLPALAGVPAAIDARRFRTGHLRAHEPKRRRCQPRLDALPRPASIRAAKQPVTVGPGEQHTVGRVQRRDAVAFEP